MDKLKIIKKAVFGLTFCIVFILCIIVHKTFSKKTVAQFDIALESADATKIDNFFVSGNYGFVVTSNKVYIIDVEKGIYKGSISILGEK